MAALYESTIRSLPRLGKGKVRDIYAVGGDKMLIVTSDRLSAFDVVLPDPIPDKGRVLTHDFAVLSWVESSLNKHGNTYHGEFVFPQKLSLVPKRTAIAIWVEPTKSIGAVQALGGWLSDTRLTPESTGK